MRDRESEHGPASFFVLRFFRPVHHLKPRGQQLSAERNLEPPGSGSATRHVMQSGSAGAFACFTPATGSWRPPSPRAAESRAAGVSGGPARQSGAKGAQCGKHREASAVRAALFLGFRLRRWNRVTPDACESTSVQPALVDMQSPLTCSLEVRLRSRHGRSQQHPLQVGPAPEPRSRTGGGPREGRSRQSRERSAVPVRSAPLRSVFCPPPPRPSNKHHSRLRTAHGSAPPLLRRPRELRVSRVRLRLLGERPAPCCRRSAPETSPSHISGLGEMTRSFHRLLGERFPVSVSELALLVLDERVVQPWQAECAALAEPHLPGLDQYMGGPLLRGIGASGP